MLGTSLLWRSTVAFTYLKVKSAKYLCLLPVDLVLSFWSCKQRSWPCCYFGLGLKNLVLFTSLAAVKETFLSRERVPSLRLSVQIPHQWPGPVSHLHLQVQRSCSRCWLRLVDDGWCATPLPWTPPSPPACRTEVDATGTGNWRYRTADMRPCACTTAEERDK